MKITRGRLKELVKQTIAEDWWSKLEPDEQDAYIKAHPKSQKAQDAKKAKDDEEKYYQDRYGAPDELPDDDEKPESKIDKALPKLVNKKLDKLKSPKEKKSFFKKLASVFDVNNLDYLWKDGVEMSGTPIQESITKSQLKQIIREEIIRESGRFKLSGRSEMQWGGNKIAIMAGNKKIVLDKKEIYNMLRGIKMHHLSEEKLKEGPAKYGHRWEIPNKKGNQKKVLTILKKLKVPSKSYSVYGKGPTFEMEIGAGKLANKVLELLIKNNIKVKDV